METVAAVMFDVLCSVELVPSAMFGELFIMETVAFAVFVLGTKCVY
jgi:hypothetical protein